MKRKILPEFTDSRRTRPEKIIHTYGIEICSESGGRADHQSITKADDPISSVESLLGYSFNDKSLLEEALTHPSYTEGQSYQRLEFIGDAVLGLAVGQFFYSVYPDIDAGQLSDLRAANISTEKFARVAVQHGLHKYIRHNHANVLSRKVREFVIAVKEEGMVVHGGKIKAPKVLADIVESVAAAVYVDCGHNIHKMWTIIKRLLEPLVMLNVVLAQPQPVTALFEACHKDGKQVDVRYTKNGNRNIANVYVDDTFIASASSLNKETAKLQAAEAALAKLIQSDSCDITPQFNLDGFDESKGIESAKHKVVLLCDKKKWQKPTFRLEQELGPSHDRKFVMSVEIELPETVMKVKGNEKSRKKDAENSAASNMLLSLKSMRYI